MDNLAERERVKYEKVWEVWGHVDIIRDHGQDVVMHRWK